MFKQQKVVLTGAPASGKTSLLEHIKHIDIQCYAEVSRDVIATAKANGAIMPFKENPLAFSEALFERRLHDYFEYTDKPVQVYDRGIHDVVAYLRELGCETPCGMQTDCETLTYDKVFIFPPWKEIFTKDAERIEDFSEAVKLHHALLETYSYFGMECIEVPKSSIDNRFEFILKHI